MFCCLSLGTNCLWEQHVMAAVAHMHHAHTQCCCCGAAAVSSISLYGAGF